MSIMQMKRGILEGRVADPGGVDQDPDSTFKKIPYPGPDPAVKKKPGPVIKKSRIRPSRKTGSCRQ